MNLLETSLSSAEVVHSIPNPVFFDPSQEIVGQENSKNLSGKWTKDHMKTQLLQYTAFITP